MKKKSNTTGTTSANPSALLLRPDADEFTSILETIAGESPEDFTSKLSTRRIEAAHRLAWCEVKEAELDILDSCPATNDQTALVLVQRKLSAILDDLAPAIALRNQTVAAASEPIRLLADLKKNVESIEKEIAPLKLRDARNSRGEPINADSAEYELAEIENYLEYGEWKSFSKKDRSDYEFKEGLLQMNRRGLYNGKPTKKGLDQRVVDLKAEIDEVNRKVAKMLSPQEAEHLHELETKLPSIRAELAATDDKATPLMAEAERATVELQLELEASAIIACAIIQAYHIKCGSATAAA